MTPDVQNAYRDWLIANKYTALEILTGESRLLLALRLQVELSPEDAEELRKLMMRVCSHENFDRVLNRCPDCGIGRQGVLANQRRPWSNPILRQQQNTWCDIVNATLPAYEREREKQRQREAELLCAFATENLRPESDGVT